MNNAQMQDTMRTLNLVNEENSDEDDENSDDEVHLTKDASRHLKKDFKNVMFLVFLYLLQGIPLGLTSSLPLLLSSRKVSYSDQGKFSFAFYPFSMKLLWAPVVDSIFVRSFGRRKSWLIPVQYLIGVFLILFSNYVHTLLEVDGNDANIHNDINMLTVIFFMFTFLAATQDIAVDGWGLEILSKENVALAATCNNTGQTAGWFIGNVIFLIFQSAEFSNRYIRTIFNLSPQTYGLIPIHRFMQIVGVLFIITTTLILFYKRERNTQNSSKSVEDDLSLKETYKTVWKITQLPAARKLIFILFTFRIAFSLNSVVILKLIDKGVTREMIGVLAGLATPFDIMLPVLISKWTNGPNPLHFFIRAYPYRIVISLFAVFWVYLTPSFKSMDNNTFPAYFYGLCLLFYCVSSTVSTTMSVTQVAFFTRISDKSIGGTYMTLLNTISNLGSHWPATLALFLVDYISVKQCIKQNASPLNSTLLTINAINNNRCTSELETLNCKHLNGKCDILVDAFYILAFLSTLIGVAWFICNKKTVFYLQSLSKTNWKIII